MSAESVSIEGLKVWRDSEPGGPRLVIDGLSLQIAAGERVAIVGPNGAGKSSLLLALVGAVPFEGRVTFGDLELDRRTLAAVRQKVGFVFADPSDQFFLPTVAEELRFGPLQRRLPQSEIEARVEQALREVGLEGFAARTSSSLSLGEQRRLALATVLTIRPAVVLSDEPTSSLDPVARRQMLETLAGIGSTVVFATHDLDAALELDARVVVLSRGQLVGEGRAGEILRDENLLTGAGLALPIRIASLRAAGKSEFST
jgi:cobalt/nickel transport system ATP-binding protein